jgi:hypothetical protein
MTRETREQDAPEEKPDLAKRPRRPYEVPRMIVYGRVKDLTAGTHKGVGDLPLGAPGNPVTSVA